MPAQELLTMAIWGVLIGLLLIGMALSSTFLKRLPISEAMIYLLVGYTLSSSGIGLLEIDLDHSVTLHRIAEAALLISLFSAGLKLQLPLRDMRWRISLRLATVALLVTTALLAATALLAGLSLGAAILIGATLSPTDPVLASDVQVEDAGDRDRLRFSLTGESGLNDGMALPLVVLGLGLLSDPSFSVWHWIAKDVLWGVGAGLAIGAGLGGAIGRLVLYLRTHQKEAIGLDEFLVLGLLALAWGSALLCAAPPFLAVFAAGLAMARTTATPVETKPLLGHTLEQLPELVTDPQHAGPLMIKAVLGFNEQLERIAEVTVVILVGALLPSIQMSALVIVTTIMLIVIIRPLAVNAAIIGIVTDQPQRRMLSWFGIRGIGSIYYLFYAIDNGLPNDQRLHFSSIVLTAVATSIVVHGISVTPLMNLYKQRRSSLD